MNLDEAIDRYTNNAEYERTHGSLHGCLEFRQLAEWLKDYKRLLEQQPCEDAISRQAALNSLIDNTHLDGYDLAEALDAIENKEKLPSITSQQKIGRWEHGKEISREYRGQALVSIDYLDWHCSNCHCVVEQSIKPKWDYCPNCGAKMIEPQESEDKE